MTVTAEDRTPMDAKLVRRQDPTSVSKQMMGGREGCASKETVERIV